ncbi:MAG: hypothetical protein A3A51_05145 [Candidatus Levybacteria bacterium RIFCSPLOWO2_01_FULL_39_10]|nr:MAG: hypothetical protein A3A51_05145 [Candidatus Levybacteria bacterium RIFCSPLOWO2_01_FULL_39_10]
MFRYCLKSDKVERIRVSIELSSHELEVIDDYTNRGALARAQAVELMVKQFIKIVDVSNEESSQGLLLVSRPPVGLPAFNYHPSRKGKIAEEATDQTDQDANSNIVNFPKRPEDDLS